MMMLFTLHESSTLSAFRHIDTQNAIVAHTNKKYCVLKINSTIKWLYNLHNINHIRNTKPAETDIRMNNVCEFKM